MHEQRGDQLSWLGFMDPESFPTLCDAVPHDFDVIVPIGSRLLVPETQGVEELVFDGGDAVAVGTDGQPLLPHAPVPHRGEAASQKTQR